MRAEWRPITIVDDAESRTSAAGSKERVVVAASAGGRAVAEDDANIANDDGEYENDADADADADDNDDDIDDGWPVRLVAAAAAAGKDPTGGRVERVENADTSIDDEVRRVLESTMVNIMVAAKIIMVDAAPLVPKIVIVLSYETKGCCLIPGRLCDLLNSIEYRRIQSYLTLPIIGTKFYLAHRNS